MNEWIKILELVLAYKFSQIGRKCENIKKYILNLIVIKYEISLNINN